MKHVLQARQSWQQRRIYISYDEQRQKVKEETESYDLILRGPTQVAQGEKLIMAVSLEQQDVLGVLFGAYPNLADKNPVYARVQKAEGANEPDVETQVKYVIGLKPKTVDHLVISQGLAKTLGVETGQEIKILETYQKPEDLNLDNLK